jgi:hypothetical protein
MKSKIILLIAVLFGLSGCVAGPATYEVFKEYRNYNVGDYFSHVSSFYSKDELKGKVNYDKNHYMYIIEYPKRCIFGYIISKSDKDKTIINWKILSGKKYCKEKWIYGEIM